MVRYLACGVRDFKIDPVPIGERMNWEVYIVTDGQMAPVFPDREAERLESQYAWVIPPGLSYGWRSGKKPARRYVIHFTSIPNALKQQIDERGYFGRALSAEQVNQVETLYRRIEQFAMDYNPVAVLELEKATIDLALLLLNGMKLVSKVPLDKIDENRLESVLVWYREHMSECPTIDAAAAAINLSSGHLRRTFQRVQGCSPHEAFMNLRLERAKELLSTTSRGLVEIGRQCGFRSDSDFCRVFSKYTGVSPHKWRTHITRQDAGAK